MVALPKPVFLNISNTTSDNVVVEWADEPRPTSNILRLIYQGRFLHGNVTLAGIFLHVFQYLNTYKQELCAFNALMLLVRWQEEHPTCKNLSGGAVIWRSYLSAVEVCTGIGF